MKTLLKKSLLTSLCQREEQPPLSPFDKGECPSLLKRGEGRFTERNCPLTYELLSKKGFTPLEKATGEVGGNRLVNSVKGCSSLTGFTLVEVLISLVVLLLVSLALMQTALVSIDSNMINVLRDEAVGIAEKEMNEARNTAFDSLGNSTEIVRRNIRNVRDFEYNVTRSVTNIGAETRQVNVEVRWNWKENPYTHRISSIVRR